MRRYYQKTQSQQLANLKRSIILWRAKALEKLGNRCVKCGFDNQLALEIDHIEPCGTSNRLRGISLYKFIVLVSVNGFQILCANCHTIKTRSNNEFTGPNGHKNNSVKTTL